MAANKQKGTEKKPRSFLDQFGPRTEPKNLPKPPSEGVLKNALFVVVDNHREYIKIIKALSDRKEATSELQITVENGTAHISCTFDGVTFTTEVSPGENGRFSVSRSMGARRQKTFFSIHVFKTQEEADRFVGKPQKQKGTSSTPPIP